MEHGKQLVDILNAAGTVVGQKRRPDVNKASDIYHTIYVFLITPKGELVLGEIPERTDLPNLYANKLGAPVATIRRHNETAEQAAVRGLQNELFIDNPNLTLLGERLHTFNDGRINMTTTFYVVHEAPVIHPDMSNLTPFSVEVFKTMLAQTPQKVAPSLQALWQTFGPALPL